MCLPNSTIPGMTREQIERAFHGTSFSPQKRAASRIDDYHGQLVDFENELVKKAHSQTQKNAISELVASYGAGLAQKYSAWINAHSRVLSPMITGPANFPTRRNEKANNTEHRRLEELIEWDKMQVPRACKILQNLRTPDEVFADDWHSLKNQIISDLGVVLGVEKGELHYNKALFKTSLAGKLQRIAKNGHARLIAKALDFIEHTQDEMFKRPVFTKRHSIWKLSQVAEQAKAKTQNLAIKEDKTLGKFTSIAGAEPLECSLIAAYSSERLRLYFDHKPNAATRTILKKSGWRWSPSVECWQRKLTQNALYNVRFITREAGLEKIEPPSA